MTCIRTSSAASFHRLADIHAALPQRQLEGLRPEIGNLEVVDTTASSMTLQAFVNLTNPTPYSAFIPAVSIHLLCNDTFIGEIIAEGLNITTGNNTDLQVKVIWDPSRGGPPGVVVARDLLSSYLSGFNTSVTLRSHRHSIPLLPHIGYALSRLNWTMPLPRLHLPGAENDESARFIRQATFHMFSSTATFTLVSPFRRNILFIDHINATAFYNHTESIGKMKTGYPFAVPPGTSKTPKLPVDWSLDSVGYETVRKALGGTLKLDAAAVVGVRLGAWTESVRFVGNGIGASVRL